jgi:hypothetical protein
LGLLRVLVGTTYLDTSAPGQSPVSATGQVYSFGDEVDFYLSAASNLISGQATGPSIQFVVYSRKMGPQTINVDYGTTNTTYQVKQTGYLVNAVVPGSGGSISCRVVISSDPFPLTVTNVSAAISGTVPMNLTEIAGVVTPAEAGGMPLGTGGAVIDPRIVHGQAGLPFQQDPVTGAATPYTWNGSAWNSLFSDASGNLKHTIAGQTYPIALAASLGGAAIDPRIMHGASGLPFVQDPVSGALAPYTYNGTTWNAMFSDSQGNVKHASYVPGTATPANYDSSGNAIHKVQGNQTVVDTELYSVSVGVSGGGTHLGTVVMAVGTRVTYILSICGPLVTPGSLMEVQLLGHTSAIYYVQLFDGTAAFDFTMAASEKLDIVNSNGDTVAHYMSGAYQGTNP